MNQLRLTLAGALATVAAMAPGVALPTSASARASCRSRAHAHFVGLSGSKSFLASGHARDCVLAAQARAGAGVLRQFFAWTNAGAPTLPIVQGGRYHFGLYDSWVLAAARHHIKVLAIIGNGAYTPPPTTAPQLAAFQAFATAMVHHYGPHGTLWRGKNRHLRRYAIRSWQIWNEPNLPQYWSGHPNAGQYARLLKAAYKGIKKADRRANVVTAGLPESLIHGAIRASRYVPRLYRAHGKRWFTTLALNPYGHRARDVMRNIRQIRRIMNRHHDRRARLWITEAGWATSGPKSPYNIGRHGQARQIGKLLRAVYHARHRWHIPGFIYYDWQDGRPYSGKDMWGLHTGLFTISGKAKPGFHVFARIAPHLH